MSTQCAPGAGTALGTAARGWKKEQGARQSGGSAADVDVGQEEFPTLQPAQSHWHVLAPPSSSDGSTVLCVTTGTRLWQVLWLTGGWSK